MEVFMKRIALLITVLALNSFSAETAPSTTTAVKGSTIEGKILAGVDLRPTAYPNSTLDNSYRTENNVIAGYQFTSDSWIFYRQDFSTNLSNASKEGGLALRAEDGSVRGGVNNIWNSGNWSLNYEGRAYVPTSSLSADSGMISYIRNYGYLNYAVNDTLKVYIAESPTVHLYSQDVNATGTASNPNVENRTYVGATWKPLSNLAVYFPVKMSNKHYRVTALNLANANWGHSVYMNPEVFYSIDSNIKVGLGLETASFVDAAFGSFSASKAFEFSKGYAVLAASL
jgi:hypothetical protein